MNPEAEFEQWYDEEIEPWLGNKPEVGPQAVRATAKAAFLQGFALAKEGRA